MKRVADDLDRDPKRQKHDKSGLDFSAIFGAEYNSTDLLNWKPGEAGYISGKICMKWPPVSDRYRIKVETSSPEVGSKQFEVAFAEPCAAEFRRKGLEFRMGQQLRVSLRGAVVGRAFAYGITLPISLKYPEGVMLEILPQGTEPGCMIDTWSETHLIEEPVEQASAVEPDDWFATPRHTKLPALGVHRANMMDIEEETSPVVASPSPLAKPASVPPHKASCAPLNNLGNALHAATPSQLPISGPSSSSHIVHSIPPAASSARRKETPLNPPVTNRHSKFPATPASAVSRALNLMDVDEEPSTVVASSSPAKPASVPSKSLEQSAVPPHNRIINKASLHAPTPLHPRSSSSLLSAVHSIPRARAAPSSVHLKENPPAHPATKPLGPPNSNAPPPTNRSRASISAFSSAAAPVTQDNPKSILPAASSVYSKENAPDRSATQSQSVPQRNGPPPPTNGTASSSKIPMAAPAVVARRAAHSASASVSDTADGKDQGLNKKQRKKLLRKEKRKMKAGDHLQVEIMTAVDPLPAHQSTAPTAPVVPTVVTREPQPSSSRPEPDIPTTSPAQVRLTPPIPYGFTPISELEAPDGRRKLYSVIGVITKNPLPLLANSGNYSCSLRIVDPTNCDESFRSNGSGTEGFMVNCFTTKYAKWLPSASEGSVMILQNIKTSMHGGNVVGTGFDDKLQWAVYDPMTGQIGHGDLGGVPKSERLDGGHGASFTPFYTGTHADLNYCKALDEWWRGVTEKRLAAMGTIHQIGGDTSYTSIGPPKRKHQLISETKTNTFFDCTVRVIHEHSAGLAHRLFVTDGTPVFGSKPCLLTMCPPSLTNCVLQIEMWDEARKLGPTLVPGELYLLRNVLLRRGRDGLTEAKMKEAKISKIGSDAGANLPNFKALLERLKPSYPDSN